MIASSTSLLVASTPAVSFETIPFKSPSEFAAFYDQYAPLFYGEIKRKLYNEEISQKVLQDAFLKIYQSIDQLAALKHTLFVWALQIVRKEISRNKVNLALNQILYTQLQKRKLVHL